MAYSYNSNVIQVLIVSHKIWVDGEVCDHSHAVRVIHIITKSTMTAKYSVELRIYQNGTPEKQKCHI